MKQQEITQYEVEKIGDIQSTEATIKADNSFLFELLSKIYSNPIGSLIRELTSNIFDSHIAAKIDDPAEVGFGKDENGEFIYFKDVGTGMSPEIMKKVYMNYGTSTKRESNEFLGAFGIGSKSPLGYQDYFYITTIVDGTKWEYILHKGDRGIPTLDELFQVSTTERNGTTVKVYIKEKEWKSPDYQYTDKHLFIKEIKKELCYFDNVYVKNCSEIDNNYKIYEGNYFKVRNKEQYSTEMHIILGKCAYPIDWKKLNLKEINVPVGIKFEIGELKVTPSREAIRYEEEIINLIKERIELTKEELYSIYEKQFTNTDDLLIYLKLRDSKAIIKIHDVSLYIKDIVKRDTVDVKFTPFEGLNIYIPENPFLFLKCEKQIERGKVKVAFTDVLTLIEKQKKLYKIKGKFDLMRNTFINEGYLIKEEKLKYNEIKDYLNLNYQERCLNYSDKEFRDKWTKRYKEKGKLENFERKYQNVIGHNYHNPITFYNKRYSKGSSSIGIAKKIYLYKKEILKQFEKYSTSYENLSIPQEWIRNYKESRKIAITRKNKPEGSVVVYDLCEHYKINQKKDKLIKEIFTKFIIYGFEEDLDRLKTIQDWIESIKEKCNYYFYVLRISKRDQKKFTGKNHFYINKFMEGKNKIFSKLATVYKINPLITKVVKSITTYEDKLRTIQQINIELYQHIEKIRKFQNKYEYRDISWNGGDQENFTEEIIEIAEKNNYLDHEIMQSYYFIEDYYKGLELLNHCKFTDESLPLIVDFIKLKKKKVNLNHYLIKISPYKVEFPELEPRNLELQEYESIEVIQELNKENDLILLEEQLAVV